MTSTVEVRANALQLGHLRVDETEKPSGRVWPASKRRDRREMLNRPQRVPRLIEAANFDRGACRGFRCIDFASDEARRGEFV